MFDSIVQCFDSITNDTSGWSCDATVDAVALSKCLLAFEFIIALHVVERYMSYTESLTRALQAKALDIVQSVQHIDVLKQVLTDAQCEVEQQFNCLFSNASKCASKHGVLVSAPRRYARQTASENHPGSPEEYYCRSLAIPFLDHLKSEIESRFASHIVLAMKCLCIIPSCFSHQTANDDEIVEFFSSDLEYISAAKAELHLWQAHFKEQEQLPDTPQSALKHATPMLYPNIRKML